MLMGPRFIDIIVDDNDGCEACVLRFKMEAPPRPVRRVRWTGDEGPVECEVVGWSSEGGGTEVPALGCPVEDSGSGTAIVVWGGDWGLRLAPLAGGAPFGESHLRLSPEDVLG